MNKQANITCSLAYHTHLYKSPVYSKCFALLVRTMELTICSQKVDPGAHLQPEIFTNIFTNMFNSYGL